jgi:hypothetical protein
MHARQTASTSIANEWTSSEQKLKLSIHIAIKCLIQHISKQICVELP